MAPSPRVRRLLSEDYSALAAIFHEVFPERPTSPGQIRDEDERRPPHATRERWVAELDGALVGSSVLTHDFYFYDPHQLILNIWVRPAYRNRGVGTALYEQAWNRLIALSAARSRCPVMENRPEGLKFLQKRGYREYKRNIQSLLDLMDYEVGWVDRRAEELKGRGIRIARLKELGLSEETRKRIYELQFEIDRAIPGWDRRPAMTFDGFWDSVERDLPGHEPFFVAIEGEQMVGMHFGFVSPGSDRFHIAFTGTRVSHRRQGLGTALRGLGVRYAKERGCSQVSTWNDAQNAPILAMNEKFGFRPQPAVVWMERALV